MKVFISGNTIISDKLTIDIIRSKYRQAEEFLFSQSYEPINPFNFFSDAIPLWLERFKLLVDCDGILMLSDWQESPESNFERYYCLIYNKSILYQDPDQAAGQLPRSQELKLFQIKNAIHEVTGMPFEVYEYGNRSNPVFYSKMLFAVNCKNVGFTKDQIAKMIHRATKSQGACLNYFRKYPTEILYNKDFGEKAGRVDKILKNITQNYS